MIKLSELKYGDIVRLNDEGVERIGTVQKVSADYHKVLIDNGIQEFWYTEQDLEPIPLTEEWLFYLGFIAESQDDGSVKYKKDSFRVVIPGKDDFSRLHMWWREDSRVFKTPLMVHQFQNTFLEQTKVYLEKV